MAQRYGYDRLPPSKPITQAGALHVGFMLLFPFAPEIHKCCKMSIYQRNKNSLANYYTFDRVKMIDVFH